MRIKVVGKTDVKGLALILMKTLTELKVTEVNGASLYFGGGVEVIEVSAAGDGLPDLMPAKKPKASKTVKSAKKATSDGWEPRQGNVSADSIDDDGSCPWD